MAVASIVGVGVGDGGVVSVAVASGVAVAGTGVGAMGVAVGGVSPQAARAITRMKSNNAGKNRKVRRLAERMLKRAFLLR